MKDLSRVMLITSVFPPSWGSGVHRISKLYKYLPDYGYFPIVLTTAEDSYGTIDHSFDPQLKKGLVIRSYVLNWGTLSKKRRRRSKGENKMTPQPEKQQKTKRFASLFLQNIYHKMMIPDDRVLWVPLAILRGYRAIRKYGIELLFSSSPHPSCHLVSLFLKYLTGLPWISDFRDPWVGNPFNSRQSWLHQFFDKLLERWVVKNSSKVVLISEPIAKEFKKRYSEMDLKKFDVLINSFDPDDFKNLQEVNPSPEKFIISHAGTFYGNRSPESFLIALTKLLDKNPYWRNRIEVRFIGPSPENRGNLNLFDSLMDVVRWIPNLPYQEMLKYLSGSTLLLLIPGPGEGTMTGKLFDYLALKKPIFLLSQENVALENLLERTQNGYVLPYQATDRIAASLTSLLQEFFKTGVLSRKIKEEELNRLTCMEMTKRLSHLMDELLMRDHRRSAGHD